MLTCCSFPIQKCIYSKITLEHCSGLCLSPFKTKHACNTWDLVCKLVQTISYVLCMSLPLYIERAVYMMCYYFLAWEVPTNLQIFYSLHTRDDKRDKQRKGRNKCALCGIGSTFGVLMYMSQNNHPYHTWDVYQRFMFCRFSSVLSVVLGRLKLVVKSILQEALSILHILGELVNSTDFERFPTLLLLAWKFRPVVFWAVSNGSNIKQKISWAQRNLKYKNWCIPTCDECRSAITSSVVHWTTDSPTAESTCESALIIIIDYMKLTHTIKWQIMSFY